MPIFFWSISIFFLWLTSFATPYREFCRKQQTKKYVMFLRKKHKRKVTNFLPFRVYFFFRYIIFNTMYLNWNIFRVVVSQSVSQSSSVYLPMYKICKHVHLYILLCDWLCFKENKSKNYRHLNFFFFMIHAYNFLFVFFFGWLCLIYLYV